MTQILPSCSPAPVVTLVRATTEPLNLAVAAARSCYSSKVVKPEDVCASPQALAQRDRVAQSTFEAGHHTIHQHAHFTFALEQVSRHLLWAFLHAHPFYNSEQVSQRYVAVKRGCYVVPPLSQANGELFIRTVQDMHETYASLVELLTPAASTAYFQIFPGRQRQSEKYQPDIKKRAQEIARYALPVATHAHLYHTVSTLTLLRYWRTCNQVDVPAEARAVVEAMVARVREVDADLIAHAPDPVPLEQTSEFLTLSALGQGGPRAGDGGAYCREFDVSLQGRVSKLLGRSQNAEQMVAQAVRDVLGLTAGQLDDDRAIARVMDPNLNPLLADTLNADTLSKMQRALHHASYTFRKKLSHSADSQDQRHRMTPGSRPILAHHVDLGSVDVIVPPLLAQVPAAQEVFMACMERVWTAMRTLAEHGEAPSSWCYLLPNAFPIRFLESGDLMHLHHKWTTRLCFTAQEEIWRATVDEVQQVNEVHPRLGQWIAPPCALRHRSANAPFCPEGPRFCGVPVWKRNLDEFQRLL